MSADVLSTSPSSYSESKEVQQRANTQNVVYCMCALVEMNWPDVTMKLFTCLSGGGFYWHLTGRILQVITGSEIALSWSPMRLKILHWRPEFHNWLPHFSTWRLQKIFHSPVGTCLKKLISDPVLDLIVTQTAVAHPWIRWLVPKETTIPCWWGITLTKGSSSKHHHPTATVSHLPLVITGNSVDYQAFVNCNTWPTKSKISRQVLISNWGICGTSSHYALLDLWKLLRIQLRPFFLGNLFSSGQMCEFYITGQNCNINHYICIG